MSNIHTPSQNVLAKTSFNGILANSTQDGTGVDCLGFVRALLVFSTWTGSATTSNFTLKDSADNSTYGAAITGATLASAVVASTADYLQLVDIDLTKRARYLKAQVVGTGTAGSASVVIYLFNAEYRGLTQTNAALSI